MRISFAPGRFHWAHAPAPNRQPQLGSTAVGVCTKEGVILAVEKRISSSLLEPSRLVMDRMLLPSNRSRSHVPLSMLTFLHQHSVEKIMEIDSHIGAAMSGLMPDARTLVDHARVRRLMVEWGHGAGDFRSLS